MQVLVRNHGEGGASAEVIDPSDGAVTHQAILKEGEQVVVTAISAHSPADIKFGEVEAIPVAEPEEIDAAAEQAPEGEAETGGANQSDAVSPGTAPEPDQPEAA